MRVLLINSMFVNQFYRRCADELGALPGVELTLLMPNGWRMNGSPMELDPLAVGAPYRMIAGKAAWKGFENRGFYLSGLIEAFRQSRPEVLYLMEEPFSIFALQVLAVRQVLAPDLPIVFFTWNNLSLSEFDYRPSLFYRMAAKWTLPKCNRAITANRDAISVLREAGFNQPAAALGYGVDCEKFAVENQAARASIRSSLKLDVSDRLIGFVGRIKYMKGVDLLVDAFAALRDSGVENIKLLLLGSGEYQDELNAQIERHKLTNVVRQVENVPQEMVPDYMRAIDIVVLPSRRVGMWSEQFGRVLIEAMAAGKIVVGSSSGAIPEVIGDAGFTFAENDSGSLFQVLNSVLALSAEVEQNLRRIARKRALEEFSWKKFAERSHEVLTSAYRQQQGRATH